MWRSIIFFLCVLPIGIAGASEQCFNQTGFAATETSALDKKMVNGKISAVKATSVAIIVADGNPVKLQVNEKTVIKRNNKEIPITELHVGEPVIAVYVVEEDAKVAVSITVITK